MSGEEGGFGSEMYVMILDSKEQIGIVVIQARAECNNLGPIQT